MSLASSFSRSVKSYFAQGIKNNWGEVLEVCSEPARAILDVGCGNGDFSRKVGHKVGAKETIGMDMLQQNIEAIRAKGMVAIQGDLNQQFPLSDDHVDLVIASHVIEHVSDTDLFVEECFRVLRPGGRLIVATPNLSAWPNVLFLMLGQQPPSTSVSDRIEIGLWARLWGADTNLQGMGAGHEGSNKHRRIFVRSTLCSLLQAYGFQIEFSGVSGFPPFLGRAARIACRIFPIYGWQLIVKARKPI